MLGTVRRGCDSHDAVVGDAAAVRPGTPIVAGVARVAAGDGLRQGSGDSDEVLDRVRTGSVENTVFP